MHIASPNSYFPWRNEGWRRLNALQAAGLGAEVRQGLWLADGAEAGTEPPPPLGQ